MAETLSTTTMLANKFQPKQKHQWILQIEGIDAFMVKSANRPTISTEPITLDWINTKRYIAGKSEFQTLSVTIYDPIAPSGAQQVMEWIRLNYESVSGRSGYADFYKRDIQLKGLDPVGTVVEHWDIKGAWLTESTFGELSYDSGEAQEIQLTIRYDNAVLQF